MNFKTKALRKKGFVEDEQKGIKEYAHAIKKSKGREQKAYKEILPQEKQHLNKLKKI